MASLNRLRDVFVFLGLMWGVFGLNWVLSGSLTAYGILPRHIEGLPGIIISPFLHANYLHLISNSIPLLVIGGFVALEGHRRFWTVTILTALLGGGLVWLFGRGYTHIGASGIVYGLFAYLLARAWWKRNFVSIVVAVIVLALYSGIILTLFIPRAGISFEGHLFGFVAGGFVAFCSWRYRKISRVK